MMKTIVCFGDSNTYGYNPTNGLRYPKEVRWPGKLDELLGDEFQVIEEGCNGRTALAVDEIEGWKNAYDYLRPMLNSHKPVDLLVIMLGSNDLKDFFHLTAVDIADGIKKLAQTAKEFTKEKQGYEAKLLIISPVAIGDVTNSPFKFGFEGEPARESKKLAGLYEKVADEVGAWFLDADKFADVSKEDSLHLTAESHKELSEVVAKKILEIFN